MPFNWNAQFDIKKLKVGIIQDSFDSITNASAKANADKMLQTFRSLGVTQFIPIDGAGVPGEHRRLQRRAHRVLRRARARRPHEGHARRHAGATAA